VVFPVQEPEWYIGAITNAQPRSLEIDCSFLEKGKPYVLTACQDGVNAGTRGTDYRTTTSTVTAADRFPVRLVAGGGWVARLRP